MWALGSGKCSVSCMEAVLGALQGAVDCSGQVSWKSQAPQIRLWGAAGRWTGTEEAGVFVNPLTAAETWLGASAGGKGMRRRMA